jgi:hypothetical protein
MIFGWDQRKAETNKRKHGVDFHEAATVFGDPLATTFPDTNHSSFEERYLTIGLSRSGAILVVAHTEKRETIRIISARKATKSEKAYYEETKRT